MKKLISGLMLFIFALTLTSCIDMNSQTKLSFQTLPAAEITLPANAESGKLNLKEIVVLIDEEPYALDAAEKIGAIVDGVEYVAGYNTLLVTYNNVTISFTYFVKASEKEVPANINIKWYTDDTSAEEFEIETAEELRGLAYLVNNGYENKPVDFADQTVKLAADIDLAGYAWTPIGEAARKVNGENTTLAYTFQGTFDGASHVISNLTDAGYVPGKAGSYENSTEKINGYVYGLFGMINAEGVVIKNVTLENVKIYGFGSASGIGYYADSVGGILGWSGDGSIEILNCKVAGEIAGYDAVGGIVGRAYRNTLKLENCYNSAEIEGVRVGGGKIAGIIGFFNRGEVTMDLCTNVGTISGNPQYKGNLYTRQNDDQTDNAPNPGNRAKFTLNGKQMYDFSSGVETDLTDKPADKPAA